MNSIRDLKDSELLSTTKVLVQKERTVTMEVLRHLQEIERRKLYAFKYGSLFDYAIQELGYSEAAASRRIQAVRLIREIPEVAPKIESGALNLSNVCQAQSFFRDVKKAEPSAALTKDQKTEVLAKLEDKSAREGQRILLSMSPPQVLPRERERMLSEEHTEMRFVVTRETKLELEKVRSLLGPRGVSLSLAELILEMAKLSAQKLSEKKFGKARVAQDRVPSVSGSAKPATPVSHPDVGAMALTRTRYFPSIIKHEVWHRDGGKCVKCSSTKALHFLPLALHTQNGLFLGVLRYFSYRHPAQVFGFFADNVVIAFEGAANKTHVHVQMRGFFWALGNEVNVDVKNFRRDEFDVIDSGFLTGFFEGDFPCLWVAVRVAAELHPLVELCVVSE